MNEDVDIILICFYSQHLRHQAYGKTFPQQPVQLSANPLGNLQFNSVLTLTIQSKDA